MTLEGTTPGLTYKDLLHMSNSNTGLDTTSRAINDGSGTASPLKLSTTKVEGDFGDGLIDNIVVRDIKSRFNDLGDRSGAVDIGFNAGNHQRVRMTGDITITLSSLPTTGDYAEITLFIFQDGSGGHNVTSWPAGTLWPGGSAPTITSTAGTADIIRIATYDAGTSYLAYRDAADVR